MADQGIKSADQGTRRRPSRKVQGSIPPPAAAAVKGRFAGLASLGRTYVGLEGTRPGCKTTPSDGDSGVLAEFASAVARRIRTGDITADEARRGFSAFDVWASRATLREETITADVRAAEAFLRRLDLGLRTADALNIAIAQRIIAVLAGVWIATEEARMLRRLP